MRTVGLLMVTVALGCGGNYGYAPLFGRAEKCHEVVGAIRDHALACGWIQLASYDAMQRACDDMVGVSPVQADVQTCLDAIAVLPCSQVDKVPKACKDAFPGLGR